MIPKSGNRFSEKDHARRKDWSGDRVFRKAFRSDHGGRGDAEGAG